MNFETAKRSLFARGEIAPASHGVWVEEKKDELELLQARQVEWLAMVAEMLKRFVKHVYENPNAGDLDYRQHRAGLHMALGAGEMLIVEAKQYKSAGGEGSIDALVEETEARITELEQIFFEWHTPIERDATLPESLRAGYAEALDPAKHQPMEFEENEPE